MESHRAFRSHNDHSERGYSEMHAPVLVLNASYEPINICAARRALVLVLKGIASAEELSSSAVHSPRLIENEIRSTATEVPLG